MDKTKIRFTILSSVLGPLIIMMRYSFYSSFRSNRWEGRTFDEELERCFDVYKRSMMSISRLCFFTKVDIIWSYYRYKATPDEYFLFDFPHCSLKKRATYLTTKHKDDVMREKVGMGENWELLENKYIFYQHFKDFFKRDVLFLNEKTTIQEFEMFYSQHPIFILKPIGGQCGVGVQKIDGTSKNADVLYKELQSQYQQSLLEQVIEQDSEMAALNMSSVNTVRLPTFMNKSGFHVLKPYLRMGRNGCVVDNTHGGGIFCGLDASSGVIRTEGMDREGALFERHPDNNHQLIGWRVPRWTELIAFAQKVHETIPYYPYVGWDFALTKDGWVLIEGNWGQFCAEYIDKEGIKEQFDSMFD